MVRILRNMKFLHPHLIEIRHNPPKKKLELPLKRIKIVDHYQKVIMNNNLCKIV